MFDFDSWFYEGNDDETDDDLTFEDIMKYIEVDEELEYLNHTLPKEIYKDIFGRYEHE